MRQQVTGPSTWADPTCGILGSRAPTASGRLFPVRQEDAGTSSARQHLGDLQTLLLPVRASLRCARIVECPAGVAGRAAQLIGLQPNQGGDSGCMIVSPLTGPCLKSRCERVQAMSSIVARMVWPATPLRAPGRPLRQPGLKGRAHPVGADPGGARLCGSPHRRPALEGCRQRQRGFPGRGHDRGSAGCGHGAVGVRHHGQRADDRYCPGTLRFAVVTNGVARALIAVVLNRGRVAT